MSLPGRRVYRFSAQLHPDGRADLRSLAPAPRKAAWRMIRELQEDPYRASTKQMRNQPEGPRRAVLGNRRMIYSVDLETRTILIERIDLRTIIYTGRFA